MWMSCTPQHAHTDFHIIANRNANAAKAHCLGFLIAMLVPLKQFCWNVSVDALHVQLNLCDNVVFVWSHFSCGQRVLRSLSLRSLHYPSPSWVSACYQETQWPLYTCPHSLSMQTQAKFWQKLFDASPPVFMHFLQVAAYNSEGKSNPSQVVEFITNPDRPSCPCRPVIRGRVLPNSFKMAWGEHFLSMPFSLSKCFTVTCSWQATKASL